MSAAPYGPDHDASRRLLLLRHGRTAWNAARRVQGQRDVDLDEVGRAEARRTAPVLAALGPVALWSSDLQRARATASYLVEATGLEPTYDARLREYGLGVREGVTHEEYVAAAPAEYAAFRRGDFDVVPGGERAAQVGERMVACLTELYDALPPGGLGIAVSHGAAIRVATAVLAGHSLDAVHTFSGLDNCGWVLFLESPWSPTLKLAAYNRVAPTAVVLPGGPEFRTHTPVG